MGDSGGPMTCTVSGQTYVAGVTSWVISSQSTGCLPNYPSVYTRVTSFLSWIRLYVSDWFRSCRALSILALICFLAGTICTGLKLFALKENKALLIAAVCTIVTAAICILTSDILLTQNIDDFSVNGVDADYGWGFALTLLGMGIAVIAVVIMIVNLVKGNGNGKVNNNDDEK
ncbi:TMPRSS11 [Mytilus edulis]|uniref:TMPRSS13 n=1 Tax=Mytilus edulis TaxID=6550 RepID=A0A8S3PTZ5_MYTED|nr:TMPRSS11 [Mytilus edulis]